MSEGTATIYVERPIEPDGKWQEVPVLIEYDYSRAEPPTSDYPGCPEILEIQNTSIVLGVQETNLAMDACWQDVRKRQKEP